MTPLLLPRHLQATPAARVYILLQGRVQLRDDRSGRTVTLDAGQKQAEFVLGSEAAIAQSTPLGSNRRLTLQQDSNRLIPGASPCHLLALPAS